MKNKNPIVLILVLITIFVTVFLVVNSTSEEKLTVKKTSDVSGKKETTNKKESQEEDTLPEDFNEMAAEVGNLKAAVAAMPNLIELQQEMAELKNLINAEKKLQHGAKMVAGIQVEEQAKNLLSKVPSMSPLTQEDKTKPDPTTSTSINPLQQQKESPSMFGDLKPPISFNFNSIPNTKNKKPGEAVFDPNQIIWITPMDGNFHNQSKESLGHYFSDAKEGVGSFINGSKNNTSQDNEPPGLLGETANKLSQKAGLEALVEPRFTIADGSVISNARTVQAMIGRIPIKGRVQDPFPFKITTGNQIFMANDHILEGVEKTIVQGIAIGNASLECVRADVQKLTFIFNDGRIVTKASEGKKNTLGYITDKHANPCLPGKLITNAPEQIAYLSAIGAVESGTQAIADNEVTTTTYSSGATGEQVTGDALKNVGFEAISGGFSEAKKYLSDRLDSYFDVIYLPPNQIVDIHIQSEIQIDYDPQGRKVTYETQDHPSIGGMD